MRINFVGDIGVFKKFEELHIDPFTEIRLPESDLNIGNFEFMVSDKHKKLFYDVQDRYSCSADFLKYLHVKKFNGLGFANNHVLDYGLEGALNTIRILKEKKIDVFGFSQSQDFSIGSMEADGIKIGIIACVKSGRWSKEKFGYGPDTYDKSKIVELIRKNIDKYDHIIIYPHWGTELIEVPNIEDTINAKAFIESGASAVIGHHPHVSQGIEFYRGGVIAYSLGSFIYAHEEEMGHSAKSTGRHVSICLNIEFSKEKIIQSRAYYYTYNPNRKIPEILNEDLNNSYAEFLNENIYNQKLFKKQFVKVFLPRELKSFWMRFKMNPVRSFIYYAEFSVKKIMDRLNKGA